MKPDWRWRALQGKLLANHGGCFLLCPREICFWDPLSASRLHQPPHPPPPTSWLWGLSLAVFI